MKISETTISEVVRRADIVEVIGEYVNLKAGGKNYKGLCPFHNEKTPSFSVSPDGVFYCFGCKESGNTISFIQKYLHLSFVESIKYLAEKYGVKIEDENTFVDNTIESKLLSVYEAVQDYYSRTLYRQTGVEALDYFFERKLTDETITTFGLGYSPNNFDSIYKELHHIGFPDDILLQAGVVKERNGKYYDFFRNRAMFPIRDFLGRVIAFGGRQLVIDKSSGKYINSPDSVIYDKKKTLFGLSESKGEIRKQGSAIIVEGYLDMLTLYQAGIKNVVAPCGTAMSKEQLQALKRYTNTNTLYLMFDGDNAGQNAIIHAIEPILELGFDLRIVVLPFDKDPDTLINDYNGSPEEINYLINHYRTFVDFITEQAQKEGKFNTPAEKSAVLKSIVKYLLLIPDVTQHKFYIDNISEIFGMNINELRNVYTQIKKEEENAKLKKSNRIKNKQNKFEQKKNNINDNEIPEIINEIPYYSINDLLPAERKILEFSLQSSEYLKKIIDDYDVSVSTFISEIAQIVFELILNEKESTGKIQEFLNDGTISADIKSVVGELKLATIDESPNWSKFADVTPETDISALIELLLDDLHIIQINNELAELQKNIANSNSQVLVRYKELTDERNALLDKDNSKNYI